LGYATIVVESIAEQRLLSSRLEVIFEVTKVSAERAAHGGSMVRGIVEG
jgi:hypothetical protein